MPVATNDLNAAQAALTRNVGAPAIDHRLITAAITDEPDLTHTAAEHGWDDPEVVDKLWAILCVMLLGITYSEQTARFLTDRHALADDVEAVHARWVAANPPVDRKP